MDINYVNKQKVALDLPERYQYIEDLGYGIFSKTYKVYDTQEKHEVALKLIANHKTEVDEEKLSQYKELNHPNILPMYDSQISESGVEYITMKYIPEGNIKQYGQFFASGINTKVNQLIDIAQGIKYLHKNNIVHGNLSLSNIFYLTSNQKSYLGDIKFYNVTSTIALNSSNVRARNDAVHYVAPESFKEESAQGDIYSLGVCLYKLLTNKFPYTVLGGDIYTNTYVGQYIHELENCNESAVHPSMENDLLDINLGDICMKAIAKRKEHRYQDIDELIEELNNYIDNKSTKKIKVTDQTQVISAVQGKKRKKHVCLLENKGINEYTEGVQWLSGEDPIISKYNYKYEFEKYNYDPAYARYLFQVAAHKGYVAASTQLGIIYEYGLGVLKDEKKAYEYYLQTAGKGNIDALVRLGSCYLEGKGVSKDKSLALKYFTIAAEESNAKAYFYLGKMCENEEKNYENEQKLITLYEKSARLGYGEAYYELGKLYTELDWMGDDQYKDGLNYLYRAYSEYGIEKALSLVKSLH